MEKERKRFNALTSAVVSTVNKERQPIPKWKAAYLAKEQRLAELEERVKAMEGQQEVREKGGLVGPLVGWAELAAACVRVQICCPVTSCVCGGCWATVPVHF